MRAVSKPWHLSSEDGLFCMSNHKDHGVKCEDSLFLEDVRALGLKLFDINKQYLNREHRRVRM
jgi:hypothetical protein